MADALHNLHARGSWRTCDGTVPGVLNAVVQAAGVEVLPILQQWSVALQEVTRHISGKALLVEHEGWW